MNREDETLNGEVFEINGPELPFPEYTINGHLVNETVFYIRRVEARIIHMMKKGV